MSTAILQTSRSFSCPFRTGQLKTVGVSFSELNSALWAKLCPLFDLQVRLLPSGHYQGSEII